MITYAQQHTVQSNYRHSPCFTNGCLQQAASSEAHGWKPKSQGARFLTIGNKLIVQIKKIKTFLAAREKSDTKLTTTAQNTYRTTILTQISGQTVAD